MISFSEPRDTCIPTWCPIPLCAHRYSARLDEFGSYILLFLSIIRYFVCSRRTHLRELQLCSDYLSCAAFGSSCPSCKFHNPRSRIRVVRTVGLTSPGRAAILSLCNCYCIPHYFVHACHGHALRLLVLAPLATSPPSSACSSKLGVQQVSRCSTSTAPQKKNPRASTRLEAGCSTQAPASVAIALFDIITEQRISSSAVPEYPGRSRSPPRNYM